MPEDQIDFLEGAARTRIASNSLGYIYASYGKPDPDCLFPRQSSARPGIEGLTHQLRIAVIRNPENGKPGPATPDQVPMSIGFVWPASFNCGLHLKMSL